MIGRSGFTIWLAWVSQEWNPRWTQAFCNSYSRTLGTPVQSPNPWKPSNPVYPVISLYELLFKLLKGGLYKGYIGDYHGGS